MSQYSITLDRLVNEIGFDLNMTTYPIFDEQYRAVLNKKIIDHYLFDEIGFETPALFRHYLHTTLNEIMPYYNQLYKTELLTYNPLHSFDYNEKFERGVKTDTDLKSQTSDVYTAESKNSTVGNVTGSQTERSDTQVTVDRDQHNKTVHSDTPQALLSIGNIEDELYASAADLAHNSEITDTETVVDSQTTNHTDTTGNDNQNIDSTETSNINTTNNLNTTEDYVKSVSGNMSNKSYSELILEFRNTFLNIDVQIISELENLFMGIA